jgi:hypothetical protein
MLFFAALLLLQSQVDTGRRAPADTAKTRAVSVSVNGGVRNDRNREPRRIPVTEEHRRTAFRTPMARALLERARNARMSQDSALMSYDVMAHMRISAGMALSRLGRDRLIFRHENVTHVQWHRNTGAWIEVKGARTAIPIIPEDEQEKESRQALDDSEITGVMPYYPGQEPLISFGGTQSVKAQVDERDIVNPLALGSEAYYTFAVGDSVSFRLPDGKVIQLRELDVRPRQPRWNLVVGSLWFDVATGQLVRAAYRLAIPIDIWAQVKEEEPDVDEDIPIWVKPLISPMRAQVKAIAIEYGLYQGRFWLPRLRSADGDAQVSFMRVPFKFEQSYRYRSVNAIDSLPEIRLAAVAVPPDSLTDDQRDQWRDSVRNERRRQRRAVADSIEQGLRDSVTVCDSQDFRTSTHRGGEGSGLKIAVRVPCDVSKLEQSSELSKSIYDEGEEIFGSKDRDELMKQALSMGAQPPLAIGSLPPTLNWGLEFTRFNRVEGLSSGFQVEQKLGSGYTAALAARLGSADLEPNGDLSLARSNMTTTVRAGIYRRLVSANDWGNPLSFGSSLSALLFGRDEGFYYRASGAEIEWTRGVGALSWRLFAERQRTANQHVTRALGPAFGPNTITRQGGFVGAATRILHSHGLDPNGFRVFTDARFETALSDSAGAFHGRGALDVTLSRGLGDIAAAMTLSGGSSVGELPPQRRWFLGGAHTIRGQLADSSYSGNAFWMGRLEVGTAVQGVRPVVFGDIGWTGNRDRLRHIGRPISGVGAGASFLDGMIRFDVARGLYPREQTRVYLYLDAKF